MKHQKKAHLTEGIRNLFKWWIMRNPLFSIRVAWRDLVGTRGCPASKFLREMLFRPRYGHFKFRTPSRGPKRPDFSNWNIFSKNTCWPKLVPSFGRYPRMFQIFEKKISKFSKLWAYGPENAKKWPPFKSKNGLLLTNLVTWAIPHLKVHKLVLDQELVWSGKTPFWLRYQRLKFG